MLDGSLEGTLALHETATLLVTTNAKVEGTVSGGNAYIKGTVNGRIDCSDGAVEFAASAHCTAHVMYRELSVAHGAEVEAELQKVGSGRG